MGENNPKNIINYEILLESYAAGECINKDELLLLELELSSQLQSIKFSRTHQGCIEKAPKHICEAAQVYEGIICIASFDSILDKANPISLGKKSTEAKVIDALQKDKYLMTQTRN